MTKEGPNPSVTEVTENPLGVDTDAGTPETGAEPTPAGGKSLWTGKRLLALGLAVSVVVGLIVVAYYFWEDLFGSPSPSATPSPPPSPPGTDVHADLSSGVDVHSDSAGHESITTHSGGGSEQTVTPDIIHPPPPSVTPTPSVTPSVAPSVTQTIISDQEGSDFDYDNNCNSRLGVTSIPPAAQCDTGTMSDMVRMAHYWDTQMTQCEGGECSGLTYSDVFNIYTSPGPGRCPTGSTALALYQDHAEGCSDDMPLDPGSPCIIPDAANFDNNRCCNLLKEYEWGEFDLSRQTAVDTSSIFALGTACNNYLPPECNLESISQPNFDTLKECVPVQDSTGSGTPVIPPSGTSLTPACVEQANATCGLAKNASSGECQSCMTQNRASLVTACNILNDEDAAAINDLYCSDPPPNNPLPPTLPIPPSEIDLATCLTEIGKIQTECCAGGMCDGDADVSWVIPDTCSPHCALATSEFFSGGCFELMDGRGMIDGGNRDLFNALQDKCQAASSTPSPVPPTGSLGGLCDCMGDKEGYTLCQQKAGVLRQRTFCTDKNTPEECAAVNSPYPNICEWTPSPNIVS